MARRTPPADTGAIDLDLEQMLSSGALEAHRAPGLWAWLCSPSAWGDA